MADEVVVRFGADAEELLKALEAIAERQPRVNQGFNDQKIDAEQAGAALDGLGGKMAVYNQVTTNNKNASKAVSDFWGESLKSININFDRTARGMISGSMTLQQGLQKAAQDIEFAFLHACERQLMSAIAQELGITEANATGNAARAASNQAAAAEKKATDSETVNSSILGKAADAAAGAYDAMASIPIVGPVLGAIAAATTFAAVMAFQSIASAEGGWDRVPYDGALAQLHKDEMVLPASLASPLRSLVSATPSFGLPGGMAGASVPVLDGGGGGQGAANPVSLSFNVTSPDAKTFRQMLLDEHGTIADAMKKAARNFHATRA